MEKQTYETPKVLELGEFAAETGLHGPANGEENLGLRYDYW